MCTLLLCAQLWPELPLLLASNRDERLDRPSVPPRVERLGAVRALAPRDLVSGGTWLGLSERGVCAAITNRAGALVDPGRRSRGELVVEALQGECAEEGFERVQGLDAREFNGFHLLVADRAGAFLCRGDGERLLARRLGAGVHVVTERSFGAASPRRAEELEAWLRTYLSERGHAPDDEALRARLAHHDELEVMDGTCVHLPAFDYGTRSSALLRLGAHPAEVSLRYAEGPPCSAAHVGQEALVRALLAPEGTAP